MIEWILHRPPHASNPAEIRVAERLRGLADSPHAWTVIWGYYYQDSRGMRREGDFLILGPAGDHPRERIDFLVQQRGHCR
jgi:hypothetical protein